MISFYYALRKSFALILPALYVTVSPVHAAPELPPEALVRPEVERAPLSKFLPAGMPLELRQSSSEQVIYIPLSDRWTVRNATLHLEYMNSISLLKERSQLRVLMNDRLLAQFPLRGDQPQASADIIIPAGTLSAGYNRLAFEVAQHYTLDCEDPTAAELWTRIDPTLSFLQLDIQWRSLAPSLSSLSSYMDKKLWKPYAVTIATVGDALTAAQLNWGGAAVQNIGLRLEYLTADLQHAFLAAADLAASPGERASELASLARNRDLVLIGRVDELRPYLTEGQIAKITGPYLEVLTVGENTGSLILVVSGIADNDVLVAARAIGYSMQAFPDSAASVIGEQNFVGLSAHAARQAVALNRSYLFSELGFQTTVFRGNRPTNMGRASIRFWLPADVFSTGNENVELRLHLVYGAAMRADSVLNIFLNENFERAIALSAKEGALFRDYMITIPLTSLTAGLNTVAFEPQLAQDFSNYCAVGQTANLALTIFDDSSITFPSATRYARLPDLRLLARTGFPVVNAGQSSLIHLTEGSSSTVAAAWTFLTKLVQTTGLPLANLKLSLDPPTGSENAVIIGPVSTLPKSAMDYARLLLSEMNQLALGLPSMPRGDDSASTSTKTASVLPDAPPVLNVAETGTLGSYKVISEFGAPGADGKTWVMISASTADQLYLGVQELVQPAVWDNLRGDTGWWQDGVATPLSQRRLPSYHVGEANTARTASYFFSQYPWWVLTTTILVLIALTYLVLVLIRAQSRRRSDLGHVE